MHPKIILFDGECNLCNFWVKFVSRRTKHDELKFASLQSEKGKEICTKFSIKSEDLSSVVFIEHEVAYTLSTAALRICKQLDGLWKLAYVFIVIPKFIRDVIYKYVSKHRYSWFGKTEQCLLPSKELASRFL